eukprot:14048152-Alexandrium_andersonii.AAC.1
MHKSQGSTEKHGVVATLDARAKRTPGLAYVALSRCQRLADVHLRTFNKDCIVAPAGVDRALGQLRLQQATAAPARSRT